MYSVLCLIIFNTHTHTHSTYTHTHTHTWLLYLQLYCIMDRIVSNQKLKTTTYIVAAKEKQDNNDYQTIISSKTGNFMMYIIYA